MSNSWYKNLECKSCGSIYSKNKIHNYCKNDTKPLIANYHLEKNFSTHHLKERPANMWRYREVLPIEKEEHIVSLGEGFTPLLNLSCLKFKYNQQQLVLKDESGNPTGSFKARGISIAVSKAKEFGIKKVCIPTAGNAGSALSAYCAKAGIEAHVFMPQKTPKTFQIDCKIMGAQVTMVKGNLADATKFMKQQNNGNWFDISTLKEPFRLEGKKTMGYEIAEQLNWKLPDVIIYPTGGGTGLIGIWKAFQEMKSLGWIKKVPTRMVAIQGDGCAPIIKSFSKRLNHIVKEENPKITIANGLRVPKPFGDELVMQTIYDSNGAAISVSDKEIKESLQEFAKNEGLFLSPEGAATWAGYKKLKVSNWIKDHESVLLLNTGSAYKYVENLY